MLASRVLGLVALCGVLSIVTGDIANHDPLIEPGNFIRVPGEDFENGPEYTVDQLGAEEGEGIPVTSRADGTGATPCETAAQWEGRASEWDHLRGFNNRFNITFDGVNHRKRLMEDKHAQLPGKRIYEYIMLYNEGIQYVINHNYNTCSILPLGTWRNHTIPPNATLEDSYEVGGPGSEFLVQEWSDRIPGRQKESWIGTFTDKGCWPVTEIFMDKADNNTVVQSVSTRFFDLSSGIKNMSVFTPPSFCPKPRLEPSPTRSTTHNIQQNSPVRITTRDLFSPYRVRIHQSYFLKERQLLKRLKGAHLKV